ncbi:uncharacterized protein [Rutidosis leptorrhynchoides]|uniref:uncharacterized protein n=1 Tax=Rutidosis leptorrhynchoides TaxID=125765 RepID=UPI003A99D8C2
MEGKKINFNRPLLSVRRNYGSRVANSQNNSSSRTKNETSVPVLLPSPSNKSDMYSGPLRDPGTVPFVWEQSPGRPKDERKSQKHHIVPKLPPGRILKPQNEDSDKITRDSKPITGPRKDSFERSKDYTNDISHLSDVCVVNRENEKPRITYGPNFLQFDDDDEEDTGSDYDEHENMPFKVCGLLPHFCLKGSIGLLNPVPGLSVRSRLPVSSANTRAGGFSINPPIQPARLTAYEHRSLVKNQKEHSDLKNESTEATNHQITQNKDGSGLYDRLQCHEISNSNFTESTPPVLEIKEVILQKKGLISFKELLAYDKAQEANSQNLAREKTLYVDTIHKVESVKADLKENDEGIFGISHMPAEPLKSDLVANNLKQDKEMITQTDVCKVPKVDQKVKASRQRGLDLPAPPPLPKSPSDSWLWRTLPSVSSKTGSLQSKSKYVSKTTAKLDKNVQSRYPQGLLHPIPES